MERLAGRYELVTEVARGLGRTMWRGHDSVLDRAVGVLVLDRDHPQAEAVREAAAAVARVEVPGLLRVIDADVDDGRVFVVTRWLPGPTVAERLASGPLSPTQAVATVGQVSEALAAAAELGVHHLVLDPRDVVLTDHGAVLVGAGVRAALEGVPADDDAAAVDAWRLGALLYATLTGRWPGHPCAGLPAAPTVDGRLARPRQVRAGVPTDVDDVTWRCLDPEAEHPLTDPAAVAAAVGRLQANGSTTRSGDPGSGWGVLDWPWARMGLAVIAGIVLAGLVLGGVSFWRDADRPGPTTTPTPTATTVPTSSPTGTSATPVEVTAAAAFDPAGSGGENDDEADAAVDGDPTTAWHTLTYTTRDLGQLKPGVGLLLDLGEPTQVGGVELELVGRGTDLQVLTATRTRPRSRPTDPLRDFTVLGSVQGAGDRVTLRSPQPVRARWVLVWLTAVPAAADGYQGGVAEATVLP